MKIGLEEVQRSEKDNAEKLETAICKVKGEKEVNAGLKQENERLVEEMGKGASQKKNTGFFKSFSHTRGGGVLLNPKTFVI